MSLNSNSINDFKQIHVTRSCAHKNTTAMVSNHFYENKHGKIVSVGKGIQCKDIQCRRLGKSVNPGLKFMAVTNSLWFNNRNPK